MNKIKKSPSFRIFALNTIYVPIITAILALAGGFWYLKNNTSTPKHTAFLSIAYQSGDDLLRSFPEVAKTNTALKDIYQKTNSKLDLSTFEKSVSFTLLPQTRIVIVSLTHTDPEAAKRDLLIAKDVAIQRFYEVFELKKNVFKVISEPYTKAEDLSGGKKRVLLFAGLAGLAAGVALDWLWYDLKTNKNN